MFSFPVLRPLSFTVSGDGKFTEAMFETDGGTVTLKIPSDQINPIAAMMKDAQLLSEKQGVESKAKLRPFERWESGITHGEHVVLIFDKGNALETGFVAHPKTARELGHALISSAREAEHAKTRFTRN